MTGSDLSPIRKTIYAALAWAITAAGACGATITWGLPAAVSADSDVATNGVLLYAEHWGGTDAAVNGVSFTAAQNNAVASPAPSINPLLSWSQGSLSSAYYSIMRGNWYSATSAATLTLKNLVSGAHYQVQLWSMDRRYLASQYQVVSGGPSLSIGTGQCALGTFTADASSQAITFDSGSQGVVNAVVVRALLGAVSASNSTLSVSPGWIPADGVATVTATVTLKDGNGVPVQGKTVALASSRAGADSISPASAPSGADGTATFTLTSTNTGTALLSAVDVTDSVPLTQTAAAKVLTIGAHGPQAAPDPVVFDQAATTDNLIVLMAAASEYSSSLTLLYSGPSYYPKHFWFSNWSHGTNDFMKWNVALATGAVYHVYAKLSASAYVPLRLSVAGTTSALTCSTRNIGWDKLDCGTISIPAGTNQLVLRRDTTNTTDTISIISLELIRESDRAAYEQRIADFRADTTWLSQSKYGLMTQFGAWGYPPTGPQPSLQDFANGFNVTNFVNLVTNTGSKYVIWSLTWWTYQMCAPIGAVTNIVPGDTNRTATRDLVGELASALHRAGVRFMMYYHCGQDGHLGYNSTDWWQAQQFPEPDHTDRGVGDRSVFFNNWTNVITEIGNRYGTNLDGWFFDDGLVYYPAPFERLGWAAKAGNANRLVCYNPWIATSYTDFEDVWMGEGSHGESQFGSTGTGGNGVFTDGPHKGILQHGMFIMEQDWGVHQQNQPITTQVSASQAIGWVQSASARGVPLSFNMMVWSDQTYSTNSLNVLLSLKNAIYGGGSSTGPTNNLVVNGGFESPVQSTWSPYAAGSTSLTGWIVDASPPDGIQLGKVGTFGPYNGSQNVQLTGGSGYSVGGGISQTLATRPGKTYTIRIDVASRDGNAVTGTLRFGATNFSLNASSTAFTTLTWQASAAGTNTLLDITGYTNSASHQLIIDNVTVTENPDPFAQWQLYYFGCTNCPQAQANADPLGKGMNNYAQFLAGLNPTNPASVLAITSAVPQGADLNVIWQTAGPRTNILQVGSSANGAMLFSDLPASLTVISAAGDTTTNYVAPGALTNNPARFYRVRVAF
jgi:hypothetical protein